MKRVNQEIIEEYVYDTFEEFEKHYEEMIKEGYKPNSDSCKPDFFHNHDMDSYYAQYYKRNRNY